MKRIGVLFATREGQTHKVASFLAEQLRTYGLEVTLSNLRDEAPSLEGLDGVVLAASIHLGKHEHELVTFVKAHRPALEHIPSAFVSVSMSERGAEDERKSPEERARFAADVKRVIDAFSAETGWHPGQVKPVAGALMYTHYNPLIRFILKRISRKEGASTDTSRDHEYTDWKALEHFAAELAKVFAGTASDVQAPIVQSRAT